MLDNTLTFEFEGRCRPECQGSQAGELWVEVDPTTEIRTAGMLLTMPNRLSLLPAPFLAAATQRLVQLPFVLDEHSDALTKQAAGVVASWFGMVSDHQAIRFPVTEGRFPQGNVVLVATQNSPLAASIGAGTGAASVSVRDNPSDPYGKVLVIAAENSRRLVDAARAFALQRYSRESDSSITLDL